VVERTCKQCLSEYAGVRGLGGFCSDTCAKRYDLELVPLKPRVFLVGEHNPYGADPAFALYPLPEHASGGRLARVLGLSADEYLRAFERRNLLAARRWSVPAAREAASAFRAELRDGDSLVLLGARVAKAFGYPFEPLAEHRVFADGRGSADLEVRLGEVGVRFLILPHPSELSRAWDDPTVPPRARAAVRRLRGLEAPTHGTESQLSVPCVGAGAKVEYLELAGSDPGGPPILVDPCAGALPTYPWPAPVASDCASCGLDPHHARCPRG
jgi:hypothetical protein